MPIDTTAFQSDLAANAVLFGVGVLVVAFRDICKRISHSDCALDEHGLRMKLPTWRPDRDAEEGHPPNHLATLATSA